MVMAKNRCLQEDFQDEKRLFPCAGWGSVFFLSLLGFQSFDLVSGARADRLEVLCFCLDRRL